MEYEISLATTMAISVLFALSLNLITGFCGQISLGHAAFLGVGAYTSGMLCKAGVPFLLTLPLAMLLAGAIGVVVGLASLRVRADFLAITTMGVGFLFVGIVRQQAWLGGELGVSAIPESGLSKPAFLVLAIVLCAATAALCIYIRKSWMGRVFNGIAEDEDTMRVLGIDVPRLQAGGLRDRHRAGRAGGRLVCATFQVHRARTVSASSSRSRCLSMVVVGGIGSVTGVVIGAAILSVLPSWFQFIGDYKLLVYGGLLFLMMRFSSGRHGGVAVRVVKSSTDRGAEMNMNPVAAGVRRDRAIRRHHRGRATCRSTCIRANCSA